MKISTLVALVILVFALYVAYLRFTRGLNNRGSGGSLDIPAGADVWDPATQKQIALVAEKKYAWTKPLMPFAVVGFVLWSVLEFAQKTPYTMLLGAGFLSFGALGLTFINASRHDMEWRRNKWNVGAIVVFFFGGMLCVFTAEALKNYFGY